MLGKCDGSAGHEVESDSILLTRLIVCVLWFGDIDGKHVDGGPATAHVMVVICDGGAPKSIRVVCVSVSMLLDKLLRV